MTKKANLKIGELIRLNDKLLPINLVNLELTGSLFVSQYYSLQDISRLYYQVISYMYLLKGTQD